MDWRDSCPSDSYEALLFQRFLKEYHTFAFKPITLKFKSYCLLNALSDDKFHFSIQSILNIRTQSPARLKHGQYVENLSLNKP